MCVGTVSIDEDYVIYPQQYIEKEIILYLEHMRMLSSEWSINHIIRTISGLIIVACLIVHVSDVIDDDQQSLNTSIDVSVAVIYYGIVWITVLAAGFANDQFFLFLIRKLASMYANYQEINEVISRRIGSTRSIVSSLIGKDGLRFGGIVITLEKGLGVGSLIFSVILFAMHLNRNQF